MNTQQNYDHQRVGEPKNGLPSKTVPSQVLPLRTLVERYMRGQDVQVFGGTYEEDPALADLERLDATERLDRARELKHAIERGRQALAQKERNATQKPAEPDSI